MRPGVNERGAAADARSSGRSDAGPNLTRLGPTAGQIHYSTCLWRAGPEFRLLFTLPESRRGPVVRGSVHLGGESSSPVTGSGRRSATSGAVLTLTHPSTALSERGPTSALGGGPRGTGDWRPSVPAAAAAAPHP